MALRVTEVQKALKGAGYPATGQELARLAKRNGAPRQLVDALAKIDGTVDGPTGVMRAMKGQLSGVRR
jgi:uncharacterized protein DUF2795